MSVLLDVCRRVETTKLANNLEDIFYSLSGPVALRRPTAWVVIAKFLVTVLLFWHYSPS